MSDLKFLRVQAITGRVDETAVRLGTSGPEDMVILQNARVPGAGKIGLRPNLIAGPTLTDADCVLAAIQFGGKVIFLGWDDSADAVLLYEWDWSTSPLTGKTFSDSTADAGERWSGANTAARLPVEMTVFEDAIFICSPWGTKALCYYGIGDANPTLVPPIAPSGGAVQHMKPKGLIVHRNHLFTHGWQDEANEDVSHAIRWSKPGTAKLAVDWNDKDYDFVGREGEDIRGWVKAKESEIFILKKRSLHGLYGHKSSNFSLTELSDTIGCAGSRAVAEWNGQVGFWDHNGRPRVFPSGAEIYLAINETLGEYDMIDPDELWVRVDEANGFFLFGAPRAADTVPAKLLVWDVKGQRWLGYWDFPSTDLSTLRQWYDAASAVPETLPPPANPPSNLTSTALLAESFMSVWVNGDNSPGTVTVIEREQTVPDVVAYADASGEIPVTDPSVYTHTGLDEKSTYNARARHERYGQVTAVGSRPVAEAKTACKTAPLDYYLDMPYGGQRNVELLINSRSGRAGAASTITLYERTTPKVWTEVEQWTGRTDESTPQSLGYDAGDRDCGSTSYWKTVVTDDASIWPDSITEYLTVSIPSC